MKIFSTDKVREIDAYTIKNEPIASIDLMERAATNIYKWLAENVEKDHKIKVFAGPGNNGGDSLVVSRLMAGDGYDVTVYMVKISDRLSGDAQANYERIKKQNKVNIIYVSEDSELPVIEAEDIVLDGIFGSGLNRPLDGFAAKAVNHINKSGAIVVAIDIPSGLFGEDNTGNIPDNIIKADLTITLQFPNLSFVFPENYQYIGDWIVLPIGLHPEIIKQMETNTYLITDADIGLKIRIRDKFDHKGHFGHGLLISGSYGKMGAAVLATEACLRTGIGLLTVHIPGSGYGIIQTAVPEAMVNIDKSDKLFSGIQDISLYNAIGIGPGIGTDKPTQAALKDLLEKCKVPVVLDADAINILGENKDWFEIMPENSILTPHPKEFERIAGTFDNDYKRYLGQVEFAKKYNVTVVLKVAHTSVACPDGSCWFNTSGNPGMATAGSGDVLTGIILSLLAQGYTAKDAALAGVFIHGLAGDIAAEELGEEALIAGDITGSLGYAFEAVKYPEV